MRGLWLEDRVVRYAEDLPSPVPPEREALVRVRLAGICNTDLELVRGYYPFTGVPGHEFVGVVESAPSEPRWTGRRVVGEINASCRRCRQCREGRPTHCENRTVLGILGRHGAHAEHLTLPVANLHPVPESVPDEVAVFTEPLAAALEVQEQVAMGPGRRVLVVGDGKLGQLIARTLALTGCELRVVGRHPDKLERVARLGIATGAVGDVGARWADVVVECTGNPEGLVVARRAVRPRGTIVLKSTYAGDATLNLSSIVVDEVTLLGSRCGPFGKAVELLASGRLDVSDLVSAEYPLAEGAAAFEAAARPGVLKVLLRP